MVGECPEFDRRLQEIGSVTTSHIVNMVKVININRKMKKIH